jgi:hypothetical protein
MCVLSYRVLAKKGTTRLAPSGPSAFTLNDLEPPSAAEKCSGLNFHGIVLVDKMTRRASSFEQGRYTRRLPPSGMVNVSISSAPSPLANGSARQAPIFPFADEEDLSCAISAMRKPWHARCAMP